MSDAAALIRAAPTLPCAPRPRHLLSAEHWRALAAALPDQPTLALLALWADAGQVHALFCDEGDGAMLPASVAVAAGAYPALSPSRPAAAWFERMILDLWGHAAEGGLDARPGLDHGRWPTSAPLSLRPLPVAGKPEPQEFLPASGPDLHVLPLGPVRAGIAEPALLRLAAQGETVVRLEVRLGWLHKGTLALMRGKSPRAAARFAARLAGDSTVAHGIAFARAAEAASGVAAPPRADALRAVMAEIERIANHLADLAAIGQAAGFAPLAALCLPHREAFLRAAATAFGHRLMMDCVVPGGVAAELAPGGSDAILAALAALEAALPALARLHDGSASLLG